MTYRQILEKLSKCSDAQLDADVKVAIVGQSSGGHLGYQIPNEPVTLETSQYGLMNTAGGLMEDWLGCMADDDLEVAVDGLYIKVGGLPMDSNEGR